MRGIRFCTDYEGFFDIFYNILEFSKINIYVRIKVGLFIIYFSFLIWRGFLLFCFNLIYI